MKKRVHGPNRRKALRERPSDDVCAICHKPLRRHAKRRNGVYTCGRVACAAEWQRLITRDAHARRRKERKAA